jgi:hypothetical protein
VFERHERRLEPIGAAPRSEAARDAEERHHTSVSQEEGAR